MNWTASSFLSPFLDDPDDGGDGGGLPPGTRHEPWFTTQLVLSITIGLFSFLVFSYCRTRWPLLFAPRTKLKGFSPHEAHAHQAFFGWILPTIRTSEFTVLQIVGLDAAVLLNFYKMSFKLFSVCSFFAVTILMPINWNRSHSYLSLYLIFTYLYTLLALYFIYKNYRRFIRSRQLFSLELVHSIPARTVLVTNLPRNLQGERPLAEYFENMGLSVESVTVCREVGSLKSLIDKRTEALLKLEAAWVSYVGNPSTVEEYDPESTGGMQQQRLVVPHRERPTIRPYWFAPKVDALEYLEAQFKDIDEKLRKRRLAKFKATQVAFVTFEKMSSCIRPPIALPDLPRARARDIVWSNMTPSQLNIQTRDIFVLCMIALLFFTWLFPITALASLLSYDEIKKTMPWLGRLIDSNDQVRAIVQNSLPSVAMITLNACLPFILEGLTYQQGYRARSWVEYSLLKKYFLFLLINVVFIFLLATTYLQLLALQAGKARNFFLSYVILQAFGIVPLQLLNLGVIIPRFFRLFVTRTPVVNFAELNAPPMINYGIVYPQAILMFVITMLYSVTQPLILIFGASTSAFLFYKPYESQGQAWPITFVRLIWGVMIFLIFMTGFFLLQNTYASSKLSYVITIMLVPLIVGTVLWSWYVEKALKPLSEFGEETADVTRLRAGHPVTWSQSNLSRRRYAQNDDTLYVAPEDERTDYSQPPMANWYSGVLKRYMHPALNGVLPQPWLPLKKGQTLSNNNDHRSPRMSKDTNDQAVVLTLRKRPSSEFIMTGDNPSSGSVAAPSESSDPGVSNPWEESHRRSTTLNHRLSFDPASGDDSDVDYGTGTQAGGLENSVASLSDLDGPAANANGQDTLLDAPISSSPTTPSRLSRYGTYFHHPERRRQVIPGAFPR
ncbi:hypothetical protein B0H13DRAFT_2447922 [Mycena leptocephala]|nr:hypothetical protein B0H13DRAFT_2447922 [Mycena leptocephala]